MAGASQQVQAARGRRLSRADFESKRSEWFVKQVEEKVNLTLYQRTVLATEHVRAKVVTNISRPVTKTVIGNKTVVTDRSVPGEFPKADTTNLMKTIFSQVTNRGKGVVDGYIGTPVDYGVILELYRDRSFLKRTLNEELETVKRIITGPLK